jgi:hypothetical protein
MSKPRWLVACRRADHSLAVSAYHEPGIAADCASHLASRQEPGSIFLLEPDGRLLAVERPALLPIENPTLAQAILASAIRE